LWGCGNRRIVGAEILMNRILSGLASIPSFFKRLALALVGRTPAQPPELWNPGTDRPLMPGPNLSWLDPVKALAPQTSAPQTQRHRVVVFRWEVGARWAGLAAAVRNVPCSVSVCKDGLEWSSPRIPLLNMVPRGPGPWARDFCVAVPSDVVNRILDPKTRISLVRWPGDRTTFDALKRVALSDPSVLGIDGVRVENAGDIAKLVTAPAPSNVPPVPPTPQSITSLNPPTSVSFTTTAGGSVRQSLVFAGPVTAAALDALKKGDTLSAKVGDTLFGGGLFCHETECLRVVGHDGPHLHWAGGFGVDRVLSRDPWYTEAVKPPEPPTAAPVPTEAEIATWRKGRVLAEGERLALVGGPGYGRFCSEPECLRRARHAGRHLHWNPWDCSLDQDPWGGWTPTPATPMVDWEKVHTGLKKGDALSAGDPERAIPSAGYCGQRHPAQMWTCERGKGHVGPHMSLNHANELLTDPWYGGPKPPDCSPPDWEAIHAKLKAGDFLPEGDPEIGVHVTSCRAPAPEGSGSLNGTSVPWCNRKDKGHAGPHMTIEEVTGHCKRTEQLQRDPWFSPVVFQSSSPGAVLASRAKESLERFFSGDAT
jgi:hypothetical protein